MLPHRETARVSEFLTNLLECRFNSLPVDFFLHNYSRIKGFQYDFKSMSEFLECAKINNFEIPPCKQLSTPIQKFCGRSFGQKSESALDRCYRELSTNPELPTDNPSSMFEKYRVCLAQTHSRLAALCMPILENSCNARKVRVTKLVRANMQTMELALRKDPHLKVLHLIRDPRGVALSRLNMFSPSARGHYSSINAPDKYTSLTREAEFYCRSVISDVKSRLRLEQSFPNRTFEIIFDDMVIDLESHARNIFQFLRLSAPPTIKQWIRTSSQTKTAAEIAESWMTTLNFQSNRHIVESCKEMFALIKRNWIL